MSTVDPKLADAALRSCQNVFRGPGGAVALVQRGEILARYTWGYADIDRAINLSPQTQLPICSISKQMVCLVLADLIQDPTSAALEKGGNVPALLDEELRKMLPQLAGQLSIDQLYNMASGIRDYWAMTVLWGARPDGPFNMITDTLASLQRTHTFHFEPGTEYSYSNVNFSILARIIENVSGQSLSQLLASRVFIPAGMKTAALCPNTYGHPLPIVGYEGDEKGGYYVATNRIEWSGDAGIVASLDDMIAYEKWLHSRPATYKAILKPQLFKDGQASKYGNGLGVGEVVGRPFHGHGGALRGFRLMRMHLTTDDLSVIVMFNHEADPGGAAEHILKKALQWQEPPKPLSQPAPEWAGSFLDEDTKLLITVETEPADKAKGEVSISYDRKSAKVKLTDPTHARNLSMEANIDGDVLHIKRIADNRILRGRRLAKRAAPEVEDLSFTKDFAGEYSCAESESSLRITGEGSLLYGFFSGFLGTGPAHLMRYVGEDVWLLACPRGMDAQPPGDWTCVFARDAAGKVTGVTVGCWLARKVVYNRK